MRSLLDPLHNDSSPFLPPLVGIITEGLALGSASRVRIDLAIGSGVPSRSFDVYSPNEHSDETGPDDSNDGEGISTADDSSDDSDVPESSEDEKEMSTLVNSTETQSDAEVIAAVFSADHERGISDESQRIEKSGILGSVMKDENLASACLSISSQDNRRYLRRIMYTAIYLPDCHAQPADVAKSSARHCSSLLQIAYFSSKAEFLRLPGLSSSDHQLFDEQSWLGD